MSQPCCPDCSPYCQTLGLTLSQSRDQSAEGWWGDPFDDGIGGEGVTLWGEECCVNCSICPTCHGK